jgi:hydroxyethylthiazole kinase-like uncharacterized protein yjeF
MRPSRHDDPLDESLLRSWPLPVDEDGDKFSRGTVLVIGGSPTTPGAVVLAGMAALRAGAGRLQIATATDVASAVAVAVPEALVMPIDSGGDAATDQSDLHQLIAGADAVLIGSGMPSEPAPVALLEHVLRGASATTVVIVDAAALAALPQCDAALRHRCRGRLLLTPNRQEVDTLLTQCANDSTSNDDADPLSEVAIAHGAVVTSFGTVCADDQRRWHTDLGHPSMGTSGSGDVLAGMAAGFAARSGDAAQAACWATFTHAATGQRLGQRHGHLGFLARELIEHAGDHRCEAPSL